MSVVRSVRVQSCLILAILSSCSDKPSATAPGTAPIAPPEFAPLFSVTDDQINYNDTWVSATQVIAETTVVQTPEPIEDPSTGQMTSEFVLTEEPKSVPVLAGYGYDGALRVTSGYSASAEDGIATVRQIDNTTFDVDAAGTLSGIALAQEPAAELGQLQDAQIDVAGTSGGGGYSCNQDDGRCTQQQFRMNRAGVASPNSDTGEPTVVLLGPSNIRVSQSMTPGALPPGILKQELKQDREYEKRGAEWILRRVRNHAVIKYAGGETRHTSVSRFDGLRMHRNAAEDAKRAIRRRARERADNSLISAETGGPRLEECPQQQYRGPSFICSGGGGGEPVGGSSYPYEPRIDQSVLIDYGITRQLGTGDKTLVLQHGFLSSAETWRRMDSWLAGDVGVNAIIRKSVPWRETYETQAAALHFQLRTQDNIPGEIILIGHSNGGMVSRYLGRHPAAYNESNPQYGYAPLNIRGAITLGTPHKGAPLARSARPLADVLGWGAWTARIICSWTNMAGCQSFGALATSPIKKYVSAFRDVPVLYQMQPNSAYHTSFNSQPESFQRYGIESYVPFKHWWLWGLNGAMQCYPWEECGAQGAVKKIDRIYKRDLSCAVVGVFVFKWSAAIKCALDAAFLKGIDVYTGKQLGAVGELTDGVVPRWSQLYPNIPMQDQYEIYQGPTHWDETTSDKVRDRIKAALRDRFQVPILR